MFTLHLQQLSDFHLSDFLTKIQTKIFLKNNLRENHLTVVSEERV